jgi:hypothetical protein
MTGMDSSTLRLGGFAGDNSAFGCGCSPTGEPLFPCEVWEKACVTIGRYWHLFKRLTAVSAGRFYRFEHIVLAKLWQSKAHPIGKLQRRTPEFHYYQPCEAASADINIAKGRPVY